MDVYSRIKQKKIIDNDFDAEYYKIFDSEKLSKIIFSCYLLYNLEQFCYKRNFSNNHGPL